jgi:group II intron reverse transcriptase/maturase
VSRKPPEASEKSDEVVVPKKPGNAVVTPADSAEERTEANGNPARETQAALRRRDIALTKLVWLGDKARKDKEEKFNNLLTHLKEPLLKEAYDRLRKDAALGVDGVDWETYGRELPARLIDLQDRIHRGSYHPLPVRRVFIPKADGRLRPLGIPALEDKIVQQAVKMILERIYEPEFLGCSYGFRPGRNQHGALDAVAVAIGRMTNWVLDADIKSFFDTIDHRWMKTFLEYRIADSRMVRLLMKWLHAGVMMEDGQLREVEEGTPQGGIISPLLANIYLHYALDQWVMSWREKHARGEMYFVRYADDFVMCFQFEREARAMRAALAERLASCGLELHPDKTRVIRFGRYALQDCRREGRNKPETFDFLGFTHIAGTDRAGRFALHRRTSRKKRKAKLAALSEDVRRRMHERVHVQHAWLKAVLRGHYQYYGVPRNIRALYSFQGRVLWTWIHRLQRRSQRARWTKDERDAFRKRWPLPRPCITHPWPNERFARRRPEVGARCGKTARRDLSGGRPL